MDTTKAYEANTQLNKGPRDFSLHNIQELRIFQQLKRTQFESSLRMNPQNINQWIQYTQFEVNQHDVYRARSLLERAIEANNKEVKLWVFYIQMEIKLGFISHARNLFYRATKILPKVSKIWFMWLSLEESVISTESCRSIYDLWLKVDKSDYVWSNYVDLELTLHHLREARLLLEQFVKLHPAIGWQKWVQVELKYGEDLDIRNVFSLAVNSLHNQKLLSIELVKQWIDWELKGGEKDNIIRLLEFGEKLFGFEFVTYKAKISRLIGQSSKIDTADAIELELKYKSNDYTLWWTYVQMKQTKLELLHNIPTPNDRMEWIQYICINLFVLYKMELQDESVDKLKKVYEDLMTKTQHLVFVKLWTTYGDFLLRNNNLVDMRKLYGRLIGLNPHWELIKHYIGIEKQLGNFKRARLLYQKALDIWPTNVHIWVEYLKWEKLEYDRESREEEEEEEEKEEGGGEADESQNINHLLLGVAMTDELPLEFKRQLINQLDQSLSTDLQLQLWEILAKNGEFEDIITRCVLGVKFNQNKEQARLTFERYLTLLDFSGKLKLLNSWRRVEEQVWEDADGVEQVGKMIDDMLEVNNRHEEDENSSKAQEDSYQNEINQGDSRPDFESRFASESEEE